MRREWVPLCLQQQPLGSFNKTVGGRAPVPSAPSIFFSKWVIGWLSLIQALTRYVSFTFYKALSIQCHFPVLHKQLLFNFWPWVQIMTWWVFFSNVPSDSRWGKFLLWRHVIVCYKAQLSQTDIQQMNSHLASVETSRIKVRCVLGLVIAGERPVVDRGTVWTWTSTHVLLLFFFLRLFLRKCGLRLWNTTEDALWSEVEGSWQ